jgi:hypothetical protein
MNTLAQLVPASSEEAELADGRLRLRGDGTVVDWLVRMRRLPATLMLDRAIASTTASPARLSYRERPHVVFDPHQYVERIAEQIRCDRHALYAPELRLDERHVEEALCAMWSAGTTRRASRHTSQPDMAPIVKAERVSLAVANLHSG